MTLDGQDVPVKLKVFNSLFVPLAKWSMLLTGNYRCITQQEPRSIRDAVHGDMELSQSIYDHVDAIAQRLGADPRIRYLSRNTPKRRKAFSSPRRRPGRSLVARLSSSASTCW